MPRTLILLGFCTAGKSTIIDQLKSRYGNRVETIDTDYEVSADYDHHIYRIYLSLCKPNNDRNDVLHFIETKEREILISLVERCCKSTIPRVISAGPFTVSRQPQWSHFYGKVSPVCYYLKLTPEEVVEGLLKRRNSQKFDEVRDSPLFGSWDCCTITQFVNNRYEALPPESAVSNVRKQMELVILEYEKLSGTNVFRARDLETNEQLRKDFYNRIAIDLSLL